MICTENLQQMENVGHINSLESGSNLLRIEFLFGQLFLNWAAQSNKEVNKLKKVQIFSKLIFYAWPNSVEE